MAIADFREHIPMQISTRDLVATMIRDTDQTMDDIIDVIYNHPTDPTTITVKFRDGTEAVIDILRPHN